ncbi:hypothetical protein VTN31DRAFT_4064 [Thermomyces dupontii]|uniref:uncharacterized protein n=1 Tax=Talaromyces thermophilus TaxID=28565 RepID=UPI0037432834
MPFPYPPAAPAGSGSHSLRPWSQKAAVQIQAATSIMVHPPIAPCSPPLSPALHCGRGQTKREAFPPGQALWSLTRWARAPRLGGVAAIIRHWRRPSAPGAVRPLETCEAAHGTASGAG